MRRRSSCSTGSRLGRAPTRRRWKPGGAIALACWSGRTHCSPASYESPTGTSCSRLQAKPRSSRGRLGPHRTFIDVATFFSDSSGNQRILEDTVTTNDTRELIVIGGGPAGYTAALYAARANLSPLVIEGVQWGGQLMITSDVENYPGYPEGVIGPAMMQDFRTQAERFGAEFLTDDVTRVDFSERPFRVYLGEEEHRAWTVIVATGAVARQLGLPSEITLQGKGVSYCAVCDAAFFREKAVVVVGGGDSAMEEATFLAKFASKVTVVHRREELRASPIMVDRAKQNDK